MTKNEQFAANMRLLGYVGTDEQFRELAVLIRMMLRLGIADNDTPTFIVRDIWGHMLTPIFEYN